MGYFAVATRWGGLGLVELVMGWVGTLGWIKKFGPMAIMAVDFFASDLHTRIVVARLH